MNTLISSDEFHAWLMGLRDTQGRFRILARLRSATQGNFGDWKSVGGGILEMRIPVGPGYRVYYARQGATVYWLLNGGDKSTQSRDIQKAQHILKRLTEA